MGVFAWMFLKGFDLKFYFNLILHVKSSIILNKEMYLVSTVEESRLLILINGGSPSAKTEKA